MHIGLMIGLLLMSSVVWAARPTGESVTLRGANFRAVVSSQSGRLTFIGRKGGANLLRRSVRVSIRDEVSGKVELLSAPVEGLRQTPSSVSFVQQLPEVLAELRFTARTDLSLEIKVKNKIQARRDLSVLLDFGGLPADSKAFLPSTYARPHLPTTRDLVYGYRAEETEPFPQGPRGEAMPLVIPSATFYSRSLNAGLTVLSPLASPVQGFQVRFTASSGIQIGRFDLRLEPGGEVDTQIFLGLHEPDWRPGLAYIRNKYPDHFMTHNPKAIDINGPFLWTPTAAEEQVRQWHDQGVRWVEIHYTYPFLGQYASEESQWIPAMDDHWVWEKMRRGPDVPARDAPFELIKHYLEELLIPWETHDKVRTFIGLLHRYDIKGLMYFNPTECWDRYAVGRFMSDATRDRNGDPVPAWCAQFVLNPRPGSAWSQYLEGQFQKMLALYPEADGIFMDQSHYDFLDFAHDDGFSIHEGIPAYRIGYSICLLTSKFVKYAHSLGKTVWWNGPFQIELGAMGTGHLTEGSFEYLQWLGIGNKPITSTASKPDDYDRMLLIGAQPASPSLRIVLSSYHYAKEVPAELKVPLEVQRDFERYAPLFQQIRQREWVLTANAVDVPTGFEANIFSQLNGNYVIPVVTSWGGDSTGTSLQVPVTVRVSDAAAIRGAYLLSSEIFGWFRAPWKRVGQRLRITIPRHRRASLLILAKTGFFAAFEGDGVFVDGQQRPLHLILDNWLRDAVLGKARIGTKTQNFNLKSQTSQSIVIPRDSLHPSEEGRFEIPMRITFGQEASVTDISFKQQFVETPRLEFGWEGTLRAYRGDLNRATLYIINHRQASLRVGLRAEGKGLEIKGLPRTIDVVRGKPEHTKLAIRAADAGENEIQLQVSATGEKRNLSIKFPVWNTRFSPDADVVSGAIVFEALVPDGMDDLRGDAVSDLYAPGRKAKVTAFSEGLQQPPAFKPRPVLVNGQQIGLLPSRNQRRWRYLAVDIPRRQLMQLGRIAEVVFQPADLEDDYQLRNVRIVLHLTDGSYRRTAADHQEHSTRVRGYGKAESIALRIKTPLE